MTPTNTKPKSSGFLKTFFIVIALVLFGILIGVLAARFLPMPGTSVTPTPTPALTVTPSVSPSTAIDETADWSTYSNATYGYSFKYPKDWTLEVDPKSKDKEFLISLKLGEIITGNVFDSEPQGSITDTRKEIVLPNNKYLLAVYSQCLGPDCGFGSLDLPTFTKFLSTIKQTTAISPTPTISMIPSGWTKREFPTVKLVLYAPSDWKSGIQSFPEIPSSLIRLWQGTTSDTSTVQLNIKNNWDNMSGQYEARNFPINDTLSATKVDPPKKDEQVLDRYQTNYVFEKDGKVYSLDCVHNWIDTNYKMCETLLKTMEFVK